MFMLWRRLQYEGSFSKQIFTASFKYCRSGKPFNVLKSVNAENKYLFGRLLETQKQRRRTIRRQMQCTEEGGVINTENKISDGKDESGVVTVNSSCIGKKKKLKSIKVPDKDTDNYRIEAVPFSSVPAAVKPSDCIDKDSNYVRAKTALNTGRIATPDLGHNKQTKKGTKKKLKTQSDDPDPSNSVEQLNDGKETPDQLLVKRYIFEPTLRINETNFPLDSRVWPSADDSPSREQKPVASFGFNDPHTKDYVTYPSVSKIIEETMSSKSRMILNKWKENMIKELGQEGFNEYNTAAKERGSQFHGAVRDAVLGRGATGDGAHSQVTRNAMRSLAWLLEHITCPLAVESVTAHPTLCYKGVPDCVATFRDIPVVVDWKLSDKPKKDLKDTYDAPVQITAYIGALNHDPNYAWTVNHGLVAVAYTNGDPCDVFLLAPKHCQIYWRHWLMRFAKFKARSHLHLEHDIDESHLSID